MKTSIKIILGLIAALLLTGLYTFYVIKNKEKPKTYPLAEVAKERIQTEAEEIAKEVDKNGLRHTIYQKVKEIDREALDKANADLLDTIAQLNITRDQLKEVTVIATTLSVKNQTLEKKIDQFATFYEHSDANSKMSVRIPKDTLQTATFDLDFKADLTGTEYTKKRFWIFKDNYTDYYFNDKRFSIAGVRSLTVKESNKNFGIRIQATTTYQQKLFGIGPGVQLDLGKVNIQYKRSYFPQEKIWFSTVNADIDLIKL